MKCKCLRKSKLAGIMLSHGVACHDVADFTGKIGKAIAPGKIMHDLSIMKKPNGWSALKDWFASMGHTAEGKCQSTTGWLMQTFNPSRSVISTGCDFEIHRWGQNWGCTHSSK